MNVDWKDILAFLGGLASLVTVLGGLYKVWQIGIKGISEGLKARLARAFWRIPRKTLIVLPENELRLWWHLGGIGNQPAMQIVGKFYITNIGENPTLIPKTYFVAYYFKWGVIPLYKRTEGHILVKHPAGDTYGLYEALPHCMTEGSADWWIVPPIKEKGKVLRGRACFLDQYGNEHWTDILRWHYQ